MATMMNGSGDGDISALMSQLEKGDCTQRRRARARLEAVGKPALPALVRALRWSNNAHLRWEAAKVLGTVAEPKTAPALVAALEDAEHEVSWLAAEALVKLRADAHLPLLRALVKKPGSYALRQAAHHVFRARWERRCERSINAVVAAMEGPAPELTLGPVAYFALLDCRKRHAIARQIKVEKRKPRQI